MKILRLETYNLASLEGKNTIDFEKGILGESNIFCIVGPTGSGKSTLLDAICLPLYGLAPRYTPKGKKNRKIAIYGKPDEEESNRLSPTDPRNILTRGQKQCYSKLTFLANDGKLYRAEWRDEFRVKRYANAETALYLITRDAHGALAEEERDWKELQQIIGLDYNQFLRTVLIAQGDFADFLNSDDETRCELLEKLVGNQDVYSTITNGVKRLTDSAKDDLDMLKAGNANMEKDLMTQESYEATMVELKALQDKEATRLKELKEAEEQLKWYASDRQLIEVRQEREKGLASAQSKREAIKQEEELLSLHDNTTEAVATYRKLTDAINNETNLKKEQEQQAREGLKLQTDIARNEEAHQALIIQAQQAAATLEAEKPKIEQAKAMTIQLESMRKDAADKRKRLTTAQKDLLDAEKKVKENVCNIAKAQTETANQQEALDQLQKDLADKLTALDQKIAETANALEAERGKTNHLDAAAIQKEKEKVDQKVTDLAKALDTFTKMEELKRKTANEEKLRSDKLTRNAEIDGQLARLNVDGLQQEVETLTRSYTLMTSENWEHHRDMLHDGEPCPLCGAKEHPYHNREMVTKVISEHKKLLDSKKADLDCMKAQAKSLGEEKAGNEGQLKQLDKNIRDDQRELANQQSVWLQLATIYPALPEDASQLETTLNAAKDHAAETNRKLADYNNLIKRIDNLRTQKEKEEKKAASFKEEATKKVEVQKAGLQKTLDHLHMLQAQTEGLVNQQRKARDDEQTARNESDQVDHEVKKMEEAIRGLMLGQDPVAYEQELNKRKTTADKAVEKSKAALDRLHIQQSNLKGQAAQMATQMKDLQHHIASQRTSLAEEIVSLNSQLTKAITEDDIQQLATSNTDWEGMRKRHKVIHDDCLTAKTQYETALKDLERHQETKPEKDEEALINDRDRLGKQCYTDSINELTFKINKHDQAAKAMGQLKEKLERASQRYADWRELLDAIGGSEGKTLRKVVQSYTLRFLVAHANAEIRRFNSRYELKQVKNSLALRVIDHDRGNDERDTTSLSGGETFIVSLGLALGLSSLSSRNISFGNLFIDEGFGTLDPDSLATVIDALSNLQTSQGKKVGVISHTDTMAERIATQVRVVKEGNTGASRIEIV